MRKSTIIALALMVLTFGGMLWLLGFYTDAFKPELEAAKEWSEDLRAEIEPGTHVRVLRVRGGPNRAGKDTATFGLLIDATPAKEAWARDPAGPTLALELTRRAFDRYGPDRPIRWVEVRLLEHKEVVRRFGFAKGDGGALDPILTEGVPPPRATPPTPSPRPRGGGIVPGPAPAPTPPGPPPADPAKPPAGR
jgi:hypothetical protein